MTREVELDPVSTYRNKVGLPEAHGVERGSTSKKGWMLLVQKVELKTMSPAGLTRVHVVVEVIE